MAVPFSVRCLVATSFLALSVSLVACGDEANGAADSADPIGATSAAIIAGSASTSADDAVVALNIRDNGISVGVCTGTAVAPNLILTARHCVSKTDSGALCTSSGTPLSGGKVLSDRKASDLYVYRGAAAIKAMSQDASGTHAAGRGTIVVVEDTDTFCNADLAFVVLDRALPEPYATIRTSDSTLIGELTRAVGFGLDATGLIPALRQFRPGIVVLARGKTATGGGAGLGDSELLVGEAACKGDSGGPLLAASGEIVGVVSRVGGGVGTGDPTNPATSCVGGNAHGVYTTLGRKPDLIARAFAAAGANPPITEAPKLSDDDAADAGVDSSDAARVATGSSRRSPAESTPPPLADAGSASNDVVWSQGTVSAKLVACSTVPGGERAVDGVLAGAGLLGIAAVLRRRRRVT